MSYKMDNLFNIFEREKNRLKDEMTLFYNKNENYLRYSNDEGRMYVFFDEQRGEEQFYYRGNDDPRRIAPEIEAYDKARFEGTYPEVIERQKKFGLCLQITSENGEKSIMLKDEKNGLRLYNIPKAFYETALSYTYERNEIGIEKQKNKSAKQNDYTRE